MENSIFRPCLLLLLWWLQSSEISSCGILFNPQMLAVISSMCDHAPMLVLPIHARFIIPQSNKHIWFRQHHILMYVRNSSKKRKYLIVKLFGTSSSDWSLYLCGCRYNGCINRWDVLITFSPSLLQSFAQHNTHTHPLSVVILVQCFATLEKPLSMG